MQYMKMGYIAVRDDQCEDLCETDTNTKGNAPWLQDLVNDHIKDGATVTVRRYARHLSALEVFADVLNKCRW